MTDGVQSARHLKKRVYASLHGSVCAAGISFALELLLEADRAILRIGIVHSIFLDKLEGGKDDHASG
jgi:hypothetical protein